jgi:hypothetical protein
MGKSRLYVHFNTAKYALRDGEFRVDIVGEKRRVAGIRSEARSTTAGDKDQARPVLRQVVKIRRSASSAESDGTLIEQEKVQDRFSVTTAPYGPATKKSVPFVTTSYEEFRSRASVAGLLDAGAIDMDTSDENQEDDTPLTPMDSMEPLMAIEEYVGC